METKQSQCKSSKVLFAGKITAALCWGGFIVYLICHRKDISVDQILAFTPKSPFLAALVMLVLFAVKSLSIVLYSGILYAASGRLFSLPVAVLVNLAGTAIMVSLPYWFGRWEGQQAVARIVCRYPKAVKLKQFRQKNDLMFTLMLRLVRFLPADIVSLYMGAIGVSYGNYLVGCLLGMASTAILYPIMGSYITNIHSPRFWWALGAELMIVACSLILCWKIQKDAAADGQHSDG